MLERCGDLRSCEQLLSQAIRYVMLVGDLPLTSVDGDHLTALIGNALAVGERESSLWKRFPACLSCYLVWQGLSGYQEGDYWSAVWRPFNLAPKPGRERRWGKAFLSFLASHDLPLLQVPSGHAYVAPILTHGGIPNSCLEEFFGSVLVFPTRVGANPYADVRVEMMSIADRW